MVIIIMFIPIMAVSCTYFNLMVRDAFKQQRIHVGELNARIEDSHGVLMEKQGIYYQLYTSADSFGRDGA